MELSAKQAIDWIGLQMNELSGEDLASRCWWPCPFAGRQAQPELHWEPSASLAAREPKGEDMTSCEPS